MPNAEFIECCSYMFRADLLGLDNLPGSSSLEKTGSPSLSNYDLPIALHLGVETYENSSSHASLSIGIVILKF